LVILFLNLKLQNNNIMMKNIFLLIFFVLPSLVFAQKKSIDVGKIDTKDFPKLKGKLWVKNPEGLDLNNVKFYENETILPVTFSDKKIADSIPKNKSILFLVSNSNNSKELEWYKTILKNIVSSKAFNSGDKIAILPYYQESTRKPFQFASESIIFSGNADEVYQKIDSLSLLPKNKIAQNQFHLAVNKALELLEKKSLELPTGIVVLANDNISRPTFQGENPVERSKRLDVPVYNIQYSTNSKQYETKDLCEQTYGAFYKSSNNDLDSAFNKLNIHLSDFIKKHVGVVYQFEYQTSFTKDGLSHTVKVNSQSDQTTFVINSPKKSISELIAENFILFIISIALILISIVVIIILIIKRKKKKKIKEAEYQAHLSDLEITQSESDRKLAEQQMELNKIQQKRDEELVLQKQEQQIKQQEQEDALQFQKMLERGNLPWFEYCIGNDKGSYQIASPRLSVGRDNSSDWVIPHPTISRRHFELNFKDYIYSIKDLGSSNGVLVNGNKISETELRHGNVIQLGELILTFHI